MSNWPLDCNDFGGTGDETEVFAIDVAESDIADMEWIEEGKSYREFLVPAELLNRCRRWRPTQDEIEGLTERLGGSRWEVLPGLDPGA